MWSCRGDGMAKLWRIYFFFFIISQQAFSESPGRVTITQVQARGSGCPAGSVSGNISPDGSAFTLLMDNYQAISNGNLQIDRKMCDVRVDLAVEPGWSYAIISADYRGFVSVSPGSVATHQAIYSFDGSKPINERPGFENGKGHAFRAQEFRGPIMQNYTIHTDLPVGLAPWSPCVQSPQATLYITTYLMARTLTNLAQSEANITLDSLDGAIQSQSYQLVWRRCVGNPQPGQPNLPPPRPRPDPGPRPPRFPR